MKRNTLRTGLSLVAALAAGLLFASNGQADAQPLRVLFIGNSYTQFNAMPETVAAMGRSLGRDIQAESCAVGGASFATHLQRSSTHQAIASAQWDAVVLQDFSLNPGQRPEDVRRRHLPSARMLAGFVRGNRPSTRIIYYETWGRRDGDQMHCLSYLLVCSFNGHAKALRDGYRMYQSATGGSIAPVGTNWQRVVSDRSGKRPFDAAKLWVNDGSHPSRLGSYLAAATILRTLIKAPVGPSGHTAGLPPPVAAYLRQIADATTAPRRH